MAGIPGIEEPRIPGLQGGEEEVPYPMRLPPEGAEAARADEQEYRDRMLEQLDEAMRGRGVPPLRSLLQGEEYRDPEGKRIHGGNVPGFQLMAGKGTDTVPAMLTPREAVLNRNAAELAGRGKIERLNRQGNRLARKGVDLAAQGGDNLRLLAQEGEESVPARLYKRFQRVIDPFGVGKEAYGDLRHLLQQFTPGRGKEPPQPAPAEKRKYSTESFPRADDINPDPERKTPERMSTWRDYMRALPYEFPPGKPDEMKGYLDMMQEAPRESYSGMVVNPELLDLQQTGGRLQKGTSDMKSKQQPGKYQGGADAVSGVPSFYPRSLFQGGTSGVNEIAGLGGGGGRAYSDQPVQFSAPDISGILQKVAKQSGLSQSQIADLLKQYEGMQAGYGQLGLGAGSAADMATAATGAGYQGGISDIGYPPGVAPGAEYHADKGSNWVGPYDEDIMIPRYWTGTSSVNPSFFP
jgi:hypothetical protein